MKKIVINSDNRRFNISSIVVGYLEENKEEVLEFEIPEKYAEYGKKACFSANGQTFAKNFDDIISNKLTITRDISQFKELDMTIEFFKIENEDEIVARTSILHILIENAIVCDDDIKPDEPKIIILDNLIDEVTKLDVLVTKNEEKRKEYYQEIQKKVDNGDFNGATFTPSVDTDGNISWTNDKNLSNPTTQNIKGPKGDKGEKGDTYTLTEQDKQDISSMTVESSESAFNQYYNGKLEDFNNNATSKTNEYNTNADNKIAEYDLHSQELDNKIIDTRNELERVKNDVLETGTATDTFVHLEDSAMAEYQELSVDGVCEQETTTGKNFLNVPQDFTFTRSYELAVNIPAGTYHLTNSSLSASDGSYNIKLAFNDNKVSKFLNNNRDTKITLPSNETKVYIYSKGNYIDSNGITATIKKFMLSVDGGEYEPYTGGQATPSPEYPQEIKTIENSLKITSCNKNLLDTTKIASGTSQGISYSVDNNGIIILNGTTNGNYVEIPLNTNISLNGTYTYIPKISNVTKINNIALKDTSFNNVFLSPLPTTSNVNGIVTKIVLYVSSGIVFNNNTLSIQILKGTQSTDNDFEKHLETQITANLPEGEFIGKINDTYKDTLKIEYNEEDGQYHLNLYKNVGKVVLDGSEQGWVYDSTYKYFRCPNYNFGDKIPGSQKIKQLSNYFIVTSDWSNTFRDNVNTNIMFVITNSGYRICIRNINYSNVEDFKTWLSTHNTEVYYALAEPYTVDLGIVDMPITYNEITNLFADSDLLPTINAKYYRNFISTVRNLQVNEKALKQELIDINNRLSALESAQTSVVNESEVVE